MSFPVIVPARGLCRSAVVLAVLAAVVAVAQAQKPAAAPAEAKVECATCHEVGASVPKDGSRHAALDMGCDSCHVQHDEAGTPDPKNPRHLKQAAPALCLECHDAKDQALIKAHRNQPVAGANCVTCHDPHVGEGPKLAYKFSHAPFAGGQCEACHQPAKAGKVALVQNGTQELCFACHDDVKQKLNTAKVKHGLFQVSDKCTDCHTPHASAHRGQLRQPEIATCESCHANRATERKTEKFLHQPASKDGCSICHEPHASDKPAHLRAEVNELCMTCHAGSAKGENGSDEKTLLLFGGKVKLPGNYLEPVKRIELSSSGKRHPTGNHPTVNIPNPMDKTKAVTCVTCHDPHAGKDSPQLLVTKKRSSSQLCIRCHK